MTSNTSHKSASAKKYGTATGFVAAWAPCLIGFAVAGPFGAIGGALIGDKLAQRLPLTTIRWIAAALFIATGALTIWGAPGIAR